MSRARRTHIYVLNQIATSMGTVDEVDESLTDGFGLRECSIESVHSITADCQDWVQYNETEEMWEALDPTCTNWESEVDYVLVCTSLREAQTYNEEEPDPLEPLPSYYVILSYKAKEDLLKKELEKDPLLFLRDCISRSKYKSKWNSLASFVPSSSLDSYLGRHGWELQRINDAKGELVNLDHFGVEISSIPPWYTPSTLFQHLRQRFLSMDDGCNSTFEPHSLRDSDIWSSGGVYGSCFDINIPANDGSVVTSYYDHTGRKWRFSTVTTPWWGGTGSHPASGNREFGLEYDNGRYVFYTRGADRMETFAPEFIEKYGFSEGKDLWLCLMANVKSEIERLGGSVYRIKSEDHQPNYQKIMDYLNGKISTFDDC